MDINDKLGEFKESLDEIVERDYKQIELNIEQEIKQAIEQELAEYEERKEANYEKNIQKLEKEYNKKIYNYEINCKKEILDEEKRVKNRIKEDVIKYLKEFTQNEKYKEYLENCINQGLSKIDNTNGTLIGLTKDDINKYQEYINQKYNMQLIEIEPKYIGGCILENKEQGIVIDNTLLCSVSKRLE